MRAEAAEADVNFQIAQTQQNAAYDQDDDEDTIVERYEGATMEAMGQAAASISDPGLREQFMNEKRLAIEQGKAKMGQMAFAKKADKKNAFVNEASSVIQKGAIEGGDMGAAQNSLARMWESMAEQGFTTHANAQAEIEKSKYTMAVGRLKTMDPESQLEALKEPWVTDLPLDVRVALKDEALNELLDDKALIAANKMIEDDLTQDEINRELLKIKDPDLLDKTQTRITQFKNNAELGKQEHQLDLYEEYFGDVAMGNLPISDIPELDTYGLSPAQLTNLQAAEARAAKKRAGEFVPVYSDPETLADLRGMVAKNEIQKARTYFSENFAKLNDSHYRYFESQVQPSKAKDPATKSLRTLNQTMNRLLRENDMEKDFGAENQIWDNLARRYDEYIILNGKVPDERTRNEWAKDEFINIKRDPDAWIFDNDETIANMSNAERADFFEAADALRQAYPGISRDQIVERYEQLILDREARADAAQ